MITRKVTGQFSNRGIKQLYKAVNSLGNRPVYSRTTFGVPFETRGYPNLEGLVVWLIFLIGLVLILLRTFDAFLYANIDNILFVLFRGFQLESGWLLLFFLVATIGIVLLPIWVHIVRVFRLIFDTLGFPQLEPAGFKRFVFQYFVHNPHTRQRLLRIINTGSKRKWRIWGLIILPLLFILLGLSNLLNVGTGKFGSGRIVVTELRRDISDLQIFWSNQIPSLLLFPSKEKQALKARLAKLNFSVRESRKIIKTDRNPISSAEEKTADNFLDKYENLDAVLWGQVAGKEKSYWLRYRAYNLFNMDMTPGGEYLKGKFEFKTTDLDTTLQDLTKFLQLFRLMSDNRDLFEKLIKLKESEGSISATDINRIRKIRDMLDNQRFQDINEQIDLVRRTSIAKCSYALYKSNTNKNKTDLDKAVEILDEAVGYPDQLFETRAATNEIFAWSMLRYELTDFKKIETLINLDFAIKGFKKCLSDSAKLDDVTRGNLHEWLGDCISQKPKTLEEAKSDYVEALNHYCDAIRFLTNYEKKNGKKKINEQIKEIIPEKIKGVVKAISSNPGLIEIVMRKLKFNCGEIVNQVSITEWTDKR